MSTGKEALPGRVAAKPRAVRTIAILNIVLASIIMLFITSCIVSALVMPYYNEVFKAQERESAARDEKARGEAIARARAEEAAARTPRERATLKARRAALEAAPPQARLPMASGFQPMADPRIAPYYWADYLTGLALNVAMLASGIGLLGSRAWARSLAVWVAGLKLLRLAILTAVFVVLVAPAMGRTIGTQMDRQFAQQQAMMGRGPAPPPVNFTKVMAIAVTAWFLVFGVAGAVYPAIVIGVLTRPGARAACAAGPKAEPDPWS